MNPANDLVPWDVPFAQKRYPIVSIITERYGEVVTLVVAPTGSDQYPKYLIRFDKVIALFIYEEAFAYEAGPIPSGFDSKCCAYLWNDSPWLESYRKGAEIFEWRDLQHYLIYGGDSYVQLIADGQPEVKRLDAAALIETKHAV